jgi:hypothetical protein
MGSDKWKGKRRRDKGWRQIFKTWFQVAGYRFNLIKSVGDRE